jgi:hypothetical protein
MHIFVLTATYEIRVSGKSHLRDHPTCDVLSCRQVSFILPQGTISREEHKRYQRTRAGQKVHRKNAVAVQNIKPLYFLSRSFEILEKYCQQSFALF